jgi:filamentous hemagglutinin
MSDAARTGYFEGGGSAFVAAQHSKWLEYFGGNMNTYVQAHSSQGVELAANLGLQRTLISWTTSLSKALEFSNGGMIFQTTVRTSRAIMQTLPGAGESEYLIYNAVRASPK